MLDSVVYPRIPVRGGSIFRSVFLSARPHLTPLFPSSSALFSVIAPCQLPCFQFFANSFPSHGGGAHKNRSVSEISFPTGIFPMSLVRHPTQPALLTLTRSVRLHATGKPHSRPASVLQVQKPRRGLRVCTYKPCTERAVLASRIERPASRSDELTHMESHSCAKPPGWGSDYG